MPQENCMPASTGHRTPTARKRLRHRLREALSTKERIMTQLSITACFLVGTVLCWSVTGMPRPDAPASRGRAS